MQLYKPKSIRRSHTDHDVWWCRPVNTVGLTDLRIWLFGFCLVKVFWHSCSCFIFQLELSGNNYCHSATDVVHLLKLITSQWPAVCRMFSLVGMGSQVHRMSSYPFHSPVHGLVHCLYSSIQIHNFVMQCQPVTSNKSLKLP